MTEAKPRGRHALKMRLFTYKGTSVRIKPGVSIRLYAYKEPGLDGLYIMDHARLGLQTFGRDEAELLREIHQWVIFLWKEYAKPAATQKLSRGALRLQKNLLAVFEEVPKGEKR